MKNLLIKTALVVSLIIAYSSGFAQTAIENCPKKGTAECPILKDCPKKGTADCPLLKADNKNASTMDATASAKLANCPLAGTADCPLIKNCPKKGTADCPYIKAKRSDATASLNDEDIPACCKK